MPDPPKAPQGHGDPSDLPELPGVTHRFVELPSGLRMHVAEAGEREAPAVVLLHGFPQNWWEWRKVIPQLAERYRVIAPDLRGAGWTDAPAEGPEAGSALYRNLILPEMGRLVSGKYGQNRLTVPTVALLGSDDRAVLPDMLAVDGDRADDLTGHMVDGAAHFLADDRPDAVVQHALELFGRAL